VSHGLRRRDLLRATGVGAAGAVGTGSLVSAVRRARSADGAVTEIGTVEELQAIRENLAGDYRLVADIDASGYDFTPIGTRDDRFVGTLYGDGHTVSNLTISAPDRSGVGLFGAIGGVQRSNPPVTTAGVVEDLTVADADVEGRTGVGALVGAHDGTLVGIETSGSVSGSALVGGVAGFQGNCGADLTSSCEVLGTEYAGGVVGRQSGLLANATGTGRVRGGLGVGGVTGYLDRGAIRGSVGTGDVGITQETEYGGGLVGINGGRLFESRAAGDVVGRDFIGVAVGDNTAPGFVFNVRPDGTLRGDPSGPAIGYGPGTVLTPESNRIGGADRIAWWFSGMAGDQVVAGPTVVDETVYLGTKPHLGGCEPVVHAVSAATGESEWTLNTQAPLDDPWEGEGRQLAYTVRSAVNVVDGTAYVKVPGQYAVLAIDADSGDVQWRAQFRDAENDPSSVTCYGGVVLAHNSRWLNWLDADTGELIERRRIRAEQSVTVHDGRIYTGGDHQGSEVVQAIDVNTREPVWRYEIDTTGRHLTGLTAKGNTVYAALGATVTAIGAETGDENWQTELTVDGEPRATTSLPTQAVGQVFVGTTGGHLFALDAVGDVRWVHSPDDRIQDVQSAPTVATDSGGEGSVVYGSEDRVYALAPQTGDKRWSTRVYGRVDTDPTVVDGRVYVGTTGGFVYGLDADLDGSSIDSRVLRGTTGHHGAWASHDASVSTTVEPNTTTTAATTTDGTTAETTDPETTAGQRSTSSAPTTPATETATAPDDEATTTDGGGGSPGLGIVGALAGLAGGGYLLARDDEGDDE